MFLKISFNSTHLVFLLITLKQKFPMKNISPFISNNISKERWNEKNYLSVQPLIKENIAQA